MTRRRKLVSFIFVVFIFSIFIPIQKRTFAADKKGLVNVAGIILKWTPKDLEKNYSRFESLVRTAADRGSRIICSTECFLDGYSARDTEMTDIEFNKYAVSLENKYITKMKKLAHELQIYLIAGVSEKDQDDIYISAVIFGPDGQINGTYRKNYLWGYEKDRYTEGMSYPVFETPHGKIGIMICYERRIPEVAEALKSNGADLIFCLSGGSFGNENDSVVCDRSRETGLPIIFVHPVEFLVTGSSGKVLSRYIQGSSLDDDRTEKPTGSVKSYELTIRK